MKTIAQRKQTEDIIKYQHSIKEIFNKLKPTVGYPENIRKDASGKWIDFYDYGDKDKDTGWDVDHVKPKTIFPHLEFSFTNLQALNWRDNIRKSNTFDYLDKTNHYKLLEQNSVISKNNRKTKVIEGLYYHVFLNAKEKVSRVCCVISIDQVNCRVLVKHDGQNHFVYYDPVLFTPN